MRICGCGESEESVRGMVTGEGGEEESGGSEGEWNRDKRRSRSRSRRVGE